MRAMRVEHLSVREHLLEAFRVRGIPRRSVGMEDERFFHQQARARTVEHTPEKARPLASKLKRIFYAPRVISDHIMVQEDFERLHKFLLETEGLSEVSDDMRKLVEQEWPELVHKLPPRVSQSG